MKILIEECKYKDPEILAFLKIADSPRNEGKAPFVGYMYYKKENSWDDYVFFLPKVILDKEGKVFGKYNPEELWAIDHEQLKEQDEFFSTFPIWIYRAVNNYYEHDKSNRIVQKRKLAGIETIDGEHVPFLENILGLIRFANENKNFLLFKMHHIHSGKGKVNWPKTISHQQPFLKKGKAPIYLNPIIKKKEIDYEEELLVIYFSVLKHINNQYGFSADINVNFDLIPKTLFEDYLHGEGTRRLREIKYKYFSDKTLQIWHLCYDFFSQKDRINSSSNYEEYLLASRFDRVFETMVDNLIGFKQEELPKYIKKQQEDDKIIDHLFVYRSLTNSDESTYYIADSKYYPTGEGTEGTSFFKQYTYARNLRHEIMAELWKRKNKSIDKSDMILCLDKKTEGYDIIPNFFLSAFVNGNNYDDGIKRRDGQDGENQDEKSFHFPNRLFDRETLLLSHYDINFLYVVKQYAINHNESIEAFRDKIYHKFRNDILDRLNKEYLFYILELKNKPEQGKEQQALKNALDPIFCLVNGKVFCPKKEPSYTNLILALENKDEFEKENKEVREALKKDFIFHEKFELGASIEEFLTKKKTAE